MTRRALLAAAFWAWSIPGIAQQDVDCSAFVPADWAQRREKTRMVMPIGHVEGVNSLAVSRDNRWLASGGLKDGSLILWDLKAQAQVLRLENPHIDRSQYMLVAFSPVANELVASSVYGDMTAWDLDKLQPKWCKRMPVNQLLSLSYGEDGVMLAASGGTAEQPALFLISAATGTAISGSLPAFRQKVVTALHSGSRMLAVAAGMRSDEHPRDTGAGCVELYSLPDMVLRSSGELCGFRHGLLQLEFSADGKRLIGAARDGDAYVWAVDERKLRAVLKREGKITSARFSSPDGNAAVTGTACCGVVAWKLAGAEPVEEPPAVAADAHIGALAMASDGRVFASHGASQIEGWRVRRIPRAREVQLGGANRGVIRRFDVTPDGQRFLIEHGATAKTKGMELRRLTGEVGKTPQCGGQPVDLPEGAFGSAMSPDGKLAVMGQYVCDMTDGKPLENVAITGYNPVFSPAGDRLYTYLRQGEKSAIVIRDTRTWSVKQTFPLPDKYAVDRFAVSPNGYFLATSTRDGEDYSVQMWNMLSKDRLPTLKRDSSKGWVEAMAFGRDGYRLAVAGFNVEWWEWVAGEHEVLNDTTTYFGASAVSFVHAGNALLAAGQNGAAQIIDLESGKRRQFLGHFSGVTAARMAGKHLFTSGKDGAIRAWTADGVELFALVVFEGGEQAVVAPDGRFDTPPANGASLVWTRGTEIVSDAGLMRRQYLENRLASKLLGLESQPPRPVTPVAELARADTPEITANDVGGKITVYVSDGPWHQLAISIGTPGGTREVWRGATPRQDAEAPRRGVEVPLARFVADTDTLLKVDVYAADKPIVLGTQAWEIQVYRAPATQVALKRALERAEVSARQGRVVRQMLPEKAAVPEGHFRALVVGANYPGSDLKLTWAAEDARAIGDALRLGAEKLHDNRVDVKVLQSDDGNPRLHPTLANIRRELQAIKDDASIHDTVVLFLAGHGEMLEKLEDKPGRYFYLTDDVRSKDQASDPSAWGAIALTSEDLKTWFRGLPAKRRAVIIDTCRAGHLGGALHAAVDDLANSHGLFLLSGSAGDKVSYESSPYGHGLLTYSLLFNFKVQDRDLYIGDRAMVHTLFESARDYTHAIARGLGLSQSPQALPGSLDETYPLVHLTPDRRKTIPLKSPRPIFTSARVSSPQNLDRLGLKSSIEAQLQERSGQNRPGVLHQRMLFLSIDEVQDAYTVSVDYRFDAGQLIVESGLNRNFEAIKAFETIKLPKDGVSEEKLRGAVLERLMKGIDAYVATLKE